MKIIPEDTLNQLNIAIPKMVGEQIRKIRKSKNITQTELGNITGKDRQYIYKIEKGIVKPNIVTIAIITLALEIELSEIFQDISLENI